MANQAFSIDLAHQSASAQELSGHDAASFLTIDHNSLQPDKTFTRIYGPSTWVYRLTLESDEEMEFIDWGIPLNRLPNAIVNQSTSDPYIKTLDLDLYCFNPDYLSIKPIVKINNKPVFVEPQEFIGALEPFQFLISYSYSPDDKQHTFGVYCSRAGNGIMSIVSTIDGVTPFVNGTYNPTQQSSTFYLYNADFPLGSHDIRIVGSSAGLTREYTYNFAGETATPTTMTAIHAVNGANHSLAINTNKRPNVNIEIYVDTVKVATILNANISSWPYYYTFNETNFDAGSHDIYAQVVNTTTAEVASSTPVTFTGTRPVAQIIAYGTDTYVDITASSYMTKRNFRGAYAKFYGTIGDIVDIYCNSASTNDTYVQLYNAVGVLLTQDDDGGSGSWAKITNYTLPATGWYFIEGSPFDSLAYPYQLMVAVYKQVVPITLNVVRTGNSFSLTTNYPTDVDLYVQIDGSTVVSHPNDISTWPFVYNLDTSLYTDGQHTILFVLEQHSDTPNQASNGPTAFDGTAPISNPIGSWSSIKIANDNQTVYASNGNSIFRSLNFGYTWSRIFNNVGTHTVLTISGNGNKIAVSSRGATIRTSIDAGQTWVNRTTSGVRNWTSIVGSKDGVKLIATEYQAGYFYTSNDSGATWVEVIPNVPAILRSFNGGTLACSDDGNTVYASTFGSGVYGLSKSTDAGATWTKLPNAPNNQITSIVCSSDGNTVVLVNNYDVYRSFDGGATFTDTGTAYYSTKITGSADCMHLVMRNVSLVWYSSDYGATWTETTNIGTYVWWENAATTDGSKVLSVINDGSTGAIYKSLDYGATWDLASNP